MGTTNVSMQLGRNAAAADAGGALTEALARFWAGHTSQDERLLLELPLPAFIQADGGSISHATLRRWMLQVRDTLAPPSSSSTDKRSSAWLVVAIAVSPCSVEESALMLLAAERRDWVYVPIDVSLPLERQLELLRTARVDRVVTLPRSPLSQLLSDDQLSKCGAVEPIAVASKPELVVSERETFQAVQVFAMKHNPEQSLQAAVAASRSSPGNGAVDEANDVPAPLYVLFTSGSTGEPKGVLGTRAGAWNRMQWMWARYPFDAREERVARVVKLAFVDSVWEIMGTFLKRIPLVHVGAPVTFNSDSADVGDSYHVVLNERCHFLERVLAHAVTRFTVVPSVLKVLLVQKSRRDIQASLASLRFLLISGETLPLELVLQIRDMLPHVTMLNLYGSTEIAGDVTCVKFPHSITAEHVAVWSEHGVPIGTSEDIIGLNTSILVVEETGGALSLPVEDPLSSGKSVTKGEVWVSGHPIALGYISSAGFVEMLGVSGRKCAEDDCSQPHQRRDPHKWFRTGDICAIIGNHLYFCGRRDRLVKIRGMRIQLEAIERVVSQALTDLRDIGLGDQCQVVAFDVDFETKYGFNYRQLVVCIAEPTPSTGDNQNVADEQDTFSLTTCRHKADICRWIAKRYGPASIPHEICKISSDAVDRLSSGKINRRGLAARYLERLSAFSTPVKRSTDTAADPVTKFVRAQLWSLLQNSDREWESSISSTLAALGADSLLTTLLHYELKQQFPAFAISPTELAKITIGDLVVALQNLQANIQQHFSGQHQPAARTERKSVVPARKRKRASRLYEPAGDAQKPDLSNRLVGLSRSNLTSSGSVFIPTCQLSPPRSKHQSTDLPTYHVAPKMELAWHADLKKCVDASALVIPTAGDSSVPRRAIIGSHAGIVLCVDIDNEGEQLWKAQLDDRVEASATLSIRHELVYVGTYAGTLFALALQSGTTRWLYHCDGMIKATAVPIDALGIVVVGAYDHKLHAVDANDGSPVWTFDVGASIFSSPVFVQGPGLKYLMCATTRGDLVSLSCSDGPYRLWGRKLPAPIFAGLSVDGSSDLAVVGCADGNVYGLAASTGLVQWTVATEKPVFSSPCLYKSCFVVIGSHDGHLRKINALSGQVVWSTLLDSAIFSSPTVFRIALPSPTSSVTSSGSCQESIPCSTEDEASERLLCCVATTVGSVYIIDEQTGEEIDCVRSLRAPNDPDRVGERLGEIFSSPVIVGRCCLVGTRANSLLAFQLAFGNAVSIVD